ncbi:MAG: hypothetical protein P8X42_10890 [Calditrichaceae bacterium]
MFGKNYIFGLCLIASVVFAQNNNHVNLGSMQNGATVSFILNAEGEWGIEISGGATPRLTQLKPAQIEVFLTENDIQKLATGYKTVQKSASGIDARAEISFGENVVFKILDHWSLKDNVVSVSRNIEIAGNVQGGFNSSITLSVDPVVSWVDINCLAPGALYGDPTYNGRFSPGGTKNYEARQILLREDVLPAPLIALSFKNGSSVAMLDPSPNGESTVEETKLSKKVMTDARFQFGTMGAWQAEEGPVEFGFQFPGAMSFYPFGPNASPEKRWFRRFHPITEGVSHKYELSFRFGNNESFRDMTRNAWRWAFNELKPEVKPIDVEQMRRVLTNHMAAQAVTIDGRTGIPFAVATFDTSAPQWNYTMVVMGFVSKNLECADQLLRESDRDSTERGKKMRQIGLSIISSMIQALSTVPLQASGYDLATGKPWTGDRQEWLAPFLRNPTEGMRVLVRAYQLSGTIAGIDDRRDR